uniref:SET domain-containing protein n=1 Tax=Eucampia antarctica TaxID=49252 RepID=A0A7S2R0F5_9STRA|mmetsp:Transcript_11510/g.11032  ORF Transcript_11510/g.11032 Transcript_11510/m.11032 type:complete len:433 (+) Transcript_11510:132-1430(+)
MKFDSCHKRMASSGAAALCGGVSFLWYTVVISMSSIQTAHAFTTITRSFQGHGTGIHNKERPMSSLSSSSSSSGVMGGTDVFEAWWKKSQGSLPPNLRHGSFESDTLRGLEYIPTESKDGKSDILTLPSSLVLSSPFITKDENDITREWDVSLSASLLNECLAGESSPMHGYCALLCQGVAFSEANPCPPWTAPNSLRHWTSSELKVLEQSSRGKKMIQALENQKSDWSKKYKALLQLDKKPAFTKEQFMWAMEAVHSRAFCGDFGFASNSILKKLSTVSIPFSFAACGFESLLLQKNEDNLPLTIIFGLIGLSPIIFKWLDGALMSGDSSSKGDAVLLPFIDSANHVEDAQSIIEFDPIKNAFSLSIGRKCLQTDNTENNAKKQLVISYGAKKDSELLLNYGFLPGLSSVQDGKENEYRQRLAQTFIDQKK